MPIKVFVSYSHANKKWVEAGQFGLIPWLSVALQRKDVKFWYDHSDLANAPGVDYRKQIQDAIRDADVSILLVSTDYLMSPFIREIEMPLIKKRLDNQELSVIPILVDHAHWQLDDGFAWIKSRQMLPSEMNPLLQYTRNEVLWSDVRAEILEALIHRMEDLQKTRPAEKKPSMDDDNPTTSLLFDQNNNLNLNLFSVNIASLLLRATKRRNIQHRAQVSPQDLIAALVRRGDLLRVLLRVLHIEPDRLYKKLVEWKEEGPSGKKDDNNLHEIRKRIKRGNLSRQDIRDMLRLWFARDKDDFSSDFLQVLEKTTRVVAAAAIVEDRIRISELDLLNGLLETHDWRKLEDCGLPPADKCGNVLSRLIDEGNIDENGGLIIRHIDKMSVNMIGMAHALAQNLGATYISHRILLTALISYEEAYGAKLLVKAGNDPMAVAKFLKETLSGPAPRTFGLTLEVCAPLLLPTLKKARMLVDKDQVITDEAFFTAFCVRAGSGFKSWLKSSRVKIDLDHLNQPDG